MKGQAIRVVALAVALLGALALIVAAVLLLARGDDSAPVVIVAPEPTAGPVQPAEDVRVQVSGGVISPGVYSMSEGDRVMDVIAAAGGLQPSANLAGVNLAQRVEDEAHYHVPLMDETPPPPESAPSISQARKNEPPNVAPSSSLVDLNTASSRELETLPGIGPVMAERIISYRNANGPFATIDAVQDVPGIGPKTLESIRLLVTVSGRP